MYSSPESPGTKARKTRDLKIKYRFRSEGVDEDMSDRIISSKKVFLYEDRLFTMEEKQQRFSDNIASAEVDEFNKRYAQIIDPKDPDLNYNRIEKIPNEYIYEVIEEQIKKNTKTQEVLRVFGKRNDNVNFFLCDFEGIIENQEIDLANDNYFRKTPKSVLSMSRKVVFPNPDFVPYRAQAIKDVYSQGKAFFFIEKGMVYECVREYEDGLYVELRSRDYGDQIGLFKKKDVMKMVAPTNDGRLLGQSSSDDLLNNEDNPNVIRGGGYQLDYDDKSDNSSLHDDNNNRTGNMFQASTQANINRKVSASRKSSAFVYQSKNFSFNNSSKLSGLHSTAASKQRYY